MWGMGHVKNVWPPENAAVVAYSARERGEASWDDI